MTSKAYENQKKSLNYSRKRVDKAGRDIRLGCEGEDRKESIEIIQNFRETHLYPLMLIKNHLSKAAKKISKKAVIARRLKRLPTILDKLERPTLNGKQKNTIKLTGMQDIGGCRAIVSNLEQLKELQEYLSKSRSVHEITKVDDYLTPKSSGYGGVHLIYSCFLGSDEENDWRKTKIEVQLRTDLQHAWATSLEIIDTLEGVNLKTSMDGQEKWREFFQISGKLVAHKENACRLESNELKKLTIELVELEKELGVRHKLFQYNMAIKVTTESKIAPKGLRKHQGMFLVVLHKSSVTSTNITSEEKEVSLEFKCTTYNPKHTDRALKKLADHEADEDVIIAVLVAANDVRNLRKAYPNYFGSTGQFAAFLASYINPKKTKKAEAKKKLA